MAIEALKGMRTFLDTEGVYHFMVHSAEPPSADWMFIGVMHPHMVAGQENPEGSNVDLTGRTLPEGEPDAQ